MPSEIGKSLTFGIKQPSVVDDDNEIVVGKTVAVDTVHVGDAV